MKKSLLALTLSTLLPVTSFAAINDLENNPAMNQDSAIASPQATTTESEAVQSQMLTTPPIQSPLPTMQSFTGLFTQIGLGYTYNHVTTTITAEVAPTTQTQTYASHSFLGQLSAGYRFAFAQHFRMGFGVLGDLSRNKASRTFSYSLSNSPQPTLHYKVHITLSQKYSIAPFISLSWANTDNLLSIYSGPTLNQLNRISSYTIDNSSELGAASQSYTKLGLLFGASAEHRINDLVSVFIKGSYSRLPKINDASALPLILKMTSAKHGLHTYNALVGIEFHLA